MVINLPVYGEIDIEMFRDKTILEDLAKRIYNLKQKDITTYNKLFGVLNEEYKKGNIPADIYEKIMDEFKRIEYQNLDVQKFVKNRKSTEFDDDKKYEKLINTLRQDFEKGLISNELYNNLINALEERRKKEKILSIIINSFLVGLSVYIIGTTLSFIAKHWNAIKWFFSHISEITLGIIIIGAIIYHFSTFDPKEYGIEVPEKTRPNKKNDNWTPPPELPDGVDDIIEQLINR